MISGIPHTYISSLIGVATPKEIAEEVSETPFEFREAFMDIPCWEVESSFISYMGYNPSVKVLELRFSANPNKAFRYREVSLDTWMEILSSKSIGKAFHSIVKGNYDYLEIFPRLWFLYPKTQKETTTEDGQKEHEND